MSDSRPRRHPDLQAWFAPDGALLVGLPARPALRASREVLDVLSACDGSRTLAEITAALLARGDLTAASGAATGVVARVILEQARAAGLLLEAGDAGESGPGDADGALGYAHPAIHRRMLRDAPRTDAFRRALEAVVRRGDVVIDLGAGSGVLSAFAARAGASAVHAIERACPDLLRQVLRDNGLQEVVKVHAGEARALSLPPARVLVSEWLGVLLFGDHMWPAAASVRDRSLAPGGVMLPSSVDYLLAPVEDASLRDDGPGWWTSPRWGLDLSSLAAREARGPHHRLALVSPTDLLAAPATLLRHDCARAGADAHVFTREVEFEVARDGTLDGLAGWFVAALAPGVELDTGPDAPPTHWRQDVLPTRPHALRHGQRLAVRVRAGEGAPGHVGWDVEARLDGAPLFEARYA